MTDKNLIVMLGDSLTAAGRWNSAFPGLKIKNMGINGDTCAGVWGRLDDVVKLNPATVFLQIGINDFLRGASPDEIAEGHERIWNELCQGLPHTRLLVISLLPYVEEALPYLPPNLDIRDLNYSLQEMADNKELTFINLFPDLTDENLQLCLDYTIDGLHLTDEAYSVWVDKIRPYVEGKA